jgi:hypothetical protein
MATTTFLSNATVNLTVGMTTYDLSDQCTACTITAAYDALEVTAFGDTAHKFTKGLQNVEVTLTMFNSYGSNEVEAALYDAVNVGTATLVISPSGTTESATNPEYTITGCMLASFTPINSTVGELSTQDVTFTGGTWARDIVSP